VLVLATHGSEYFQEHTNFRGGKFSSPLIGGIALSPTPETDSVGSTFRLDTKEPTSSREGHYAHENEATVFFRSSDAKEE